MLTERSTTPQEASGFRKKPLLSVEGERLRECKGGGATPRRECESGGRQWPQVVEKDG
jgi:hypothetical protein